jgi:hypothetical protein
MSGAAEGPRRLVADNERVQRDRRALVLKIPTRIRFEEDPKKYGPPPGATIANWGPEGICPLCLRRGEVGDCCPHCDPTGVEEDRAFLQEFRFREVQSRKRPGAATVTRETHGECPRCSKWGEVGKFCLRCCRLAEMEIGVCRDCLDPGPLKEVCQECEGACYGTPLWSKPDPPEPEPDPQEELGTLCKEAPYDEDVQMRGNCPLCDEEGIRGCICSGCEDMGMCYE